jgi:hypothetical protein
MSQNGSGPKCPQPQRLRELIDIVGDSTIAQGAEHDIIDALDWLATMLDNRSLYHKKQQLKKKIIFSLAKEHGLDDEANALTDSALHSFVSKQPLDKDDLANLDLSALEEDNAN